MARIPRKINSWDRFIKVPDLIHPDFADHNTRALLKKARIEAMASIAKVARKLGTSDGNLWEWEEGVKPIPEFVAVNWARILLVRFKDIREAYLKDTAARLNVADRDGVDKWTRKNTKHSSRQLNQNTQEALPRSQKGTPSRD